VRPAGDDRRYVRAIERAWLDLLGRPAVVSPREFATIDGWRRRGIPLSVVLEVFGAFGKRHSGRSPKSLTSLARAVDEAWSVVAAGRAAPRVPDARALRSEALRAWETALGRSLEGDPLHDLLTRTLAEAARDASGSDLDAMLDSSLPHAVPDAMLASASERTERDLAGFRGRMSEREFRNTFARALADRLRETLALPRLALARADPSRRMAPPRLE
jgi:hypothetical protein